MTSNNYILTSSIAPLAFNVFSNVCMLITKNLTCFGFVDIIIDFYKP